MPLAKARVREQDRGGAVAALGISRGKLYTSLPMSLPIRILMTPYRQKVITPDAAMELSRARG